MNLQEGYYINNFLIFGNLDRTGFAAKGFEICPPDLRNAAVNTLHEFEDRFSI